MLYSVKVLKFKHNNKNNIGTYKLEETYEDNVSIYSKSLPDTYQIQKN